MNIPPMIVRDDYLILKRRPKSYDTIGRLIEVFMAMNCISKTIPTTPASWRWLLWAAFVIVWTTALLTTEPVHVAHAVLAPSAIIPTSKLLHVSAYALLAVLSGWLIVPTRWRWVLLLFMCCHAFGTEFFQQFVPERGPSLRDVGIDHIGIALGLAVSCRWWLQFDKSNSSEAVNQKN